MEEKPLYGGLTVYRERGAYLRRLEQYEKAKDAYDEALRFDPNDVSLLTGRGQIYVDVMKPQPAQNTAELVLKLEPNNMLAKSMQARAEFTLGEFEKAVVTNYRGCRIRKQPPYFQDGIKIGREIIQECIGEKAHDVMLDFLPLIKRNQEMLADESEPKKTMRVSRIPKVENVQKLTQEKARQKRNLSRVLATKYLGPVAQDKFFVQKLKTDQRLISANAQGSKKLKQLVDEALNVLTTRQDTLRTQRPYYTIKTAEKCVSKSQIKFNQSLLNNERVIAVRTAERYLKDISRYLHAHLIKDLMFKAKCFQSFLDSKSIHILPKKDIFIDRLYQAIGEGYLSQYRLSYTLSERSNRRRVAFLMGMKVGRPSSYDSVMATYPHSFDTVTHAIDKLSQTLHMCENARQKCWIQYELALMLTQQKNYPLAKFYAKCCQKDAIELSDDVWWMNGCFAILCGDMQQGNAHDVCDLVDGAVQNVHKLRAREQVMAFLLKIKEMVLSPVVMNDRQLTERREKEILNIMDEKSRVDTGVLFKRMSTIPGKRQFSVLPRPPTAESVFSERHSYRQKRLTVVPGLDKPLLLPPVSLTRGFQVFDI